MPFAFLLLAIALYSPVIIEHPTLLTSPRDIYIVTRVGYGIESFLSTLCVYIGFILLLFRKEKNRLLGSVFILASVVVLYLHGSKGQFVGLLLIWLYFAAFVKGRRFGVGRLAALGIGSTVLLATLFYFTFSAYFRQNLIVAIASYASEYTRNASLVIDDSNMEPQLGRLTLENSAYAFIPRKLFPEKRKDFGTLWLANKYYPVRYQDESGAPAFGMGFYYADFGAFAIVYYVISELFAGIFLKILATRLQRRPDAGTFVLFLDFMDVPLVPTGLGFPLILYYLIAQIVKIISAEPEVQIRDVGFVEA
jgi:oligosaccharide repeat unit polymerase